MRVRFDPMVNPFSAAALDAHVPVEITMYAHAESGGRGGLKTMGLSSTSGSVDATFTTAGRGEHYVYAKIDDGSFIETIDLGWVRIT